MIAIDPKAGTLEREWTTCRHLHAVPPLNLGETGRIVVVAPHPDDETLGIGGALHDLAERASEVEVVALTDGEASHPNSPTHSREQLAARRTREQTDALTALGLLRATRTRLHLPDGALAKVKDLAARLTPIVRGASRCFVTWRHDGHPDHDAAGAATAAACTALGVPLAEFPVWAWNWAQPNTRDLPWSRARRWPLSSEAIRAKAHAIAAYRSQLEPLSNAAGDEPILPSATLAHFMRDFEVMFV